MGYTEGPGEATPRALGSPSLVTGIPVNKPRAPPLTRPGHIFRSLRSSQIRDAETKQVSYSFGLSKRHSRMWYSRNQERRVLRSIYYPNHDLSKLSPPAYTCLSSQFFDRRVTCLKILLNWLTVQYVKVVAISSDSYRLLSDTSLASINGSYRW
jgi:hypothetical protein